MEESLLPWSENHIYGRHIWLVKTPADVQDTAAASLFKGAFALRGYNGQVIALLPEIDTVLLRLGWTVGRDFEEPQFLSDFLKTVRIR